MALTEQGKQAKTTITNNGEKMVINGNETTSISANLAKNSATIVSDGKMDEAEKTRLHAMIGNANAQNTRAFNGQKGVVADVDDIKVNNTLVFSGCTDCTYTITKTCTKVFIQGCENFKLVCNERIMTQTLEVYKSNKVTVEVNNYAIRTFQSDIVDGLDIIYKTRALFDYVFWAGTQDLSIRFKDNDKINFKTGYDVMNVRDKSLVFERTQFKSQFVVDKLITEKVVRLNNGFPTTARENDAFERRQEENLAELAAQMDIKIHAKGAKALGNGEKKKKIGRNEKCPCGSTMKYKVCCGKWA